MVGRASRSAFGSSLFIWEIKAGGGNLVLQIGSLALRLLSAVLIARLLGAEAFGEFAFGVAFAALLVLPASLGLPELTVREVAGSRATGDWGAARRLIGWSLKNGLLGAVAIAGSAAVLIGNLAGPSAQLAESAMIAVSATPFAVLARISGGALRGLGYPVLGKVGETMLPPAVLVSALAAGGADVIPLESSTGVLFVYVGAAGLGALFASGLLAAALRKVAGGGAGFGATQKGSSGDQRRQARVWRKAALPMAIIASMQVVLTNSDVLMLGMLKTTSEAGVYRVASRGAEMTAVVLAAANAVLQPRVAACFAAGQMDALQKLLTQAARLVFVTATASGAVLMVAGPIGLRVVFGNEFGSAYAPMMILVVAQLVNAAAGSAGVVLSMTGNQGRVAGVLVGGALANVLLNILLIPAFGSEGAAIATAVSLATWNVVMAVGAVRVVGINPTIFRNKFQFAAARERWQ